MANPTTGVTSSSSCATKTRDNASLGSICPKGWTLPDYSSDIAPGILWDNGDPGMLATSGNFYSDSQRNVGGSGSWWSSTRDSSYYAYRLYFNSTSAVRGSYDKYYGYSVRCMRSS